jgi:hydrophobe/amphiphile efflux-3 (HAE3) family protein
MSLDEQATTVADVNRQLAERQFSGVRTTATGSAALLREINDRTKSDMARTGLLALAVMVAVLLLVFRARWRLLALPLVGIGMVWAFGAFGYLGIPFNMVTISGLPILVGLGVDFAVQVHARYEEEGTDGRATPLRDALAGVGPALVVALVAAAAGFLALRISPVPMIGQFAVMLAVGVGVILVAVLALVPVALVWRDRRGGYRSPRPGRFGVERLVRGLTSAAGSHPAIIVGVALVIAVAGFAARGQVPVESDPEKFVAADSPVLRDLHELRDVAGTSADIGVMVEADDVLRADVLRWMAAYEQREVERHRGALLQSNSVASITAQVTGSTPTPHDVRTVMAAAPAGISRTFLDPSGTRAQMLFSVGHLSLDDQEELLAAMARDVDAPPGVQVAASGLSVVGIETVRSLEEDRTETTVAALVAVFGWLLVAFRSLRRSLLALLPVVTAVGASTLAIYLLGVTVSALGALSGPLVIAVCTEFSVLILERCDEERRRGRSPEAAVATASLSIGRAFTASGLTIAGGFAVLALSGFPLLSSFGIVVAVNVVAAMLCALVILPPLLRRAGAVPGPAPAGARRVHRRPAVGASTHETA